MEKLCHWHSSVHGAVRSHWRIMPNSHARRLHAPARDIREIDRLESAIGPMRKLGVVQDTTLLSSFGAIQDWVTYLEYLEKTRREKK